jgi:hypothetical protein
MGVWLLQQHQKNLSRVDVVKVVALYQYVSKFILCFIKFEMNLDKFTMAKVVNPIVHDD